MKIIYDVIIIGGGSAGCTAAKTARAAGKSVLLFNAVTPSPMGSSWGFGGTCINVGCVPKKLYHQVSQVHEFRDLGMTAHLDWPRFASKVSTFTKRIGLQTLNVLKSKDIDVINAVAKVSTDTNKAIVNADGKAYGCDTCIIATGSRPNVGDFVGNNLCMTSDDIFFIETIPESAVIYGGGYIALECAGILQGLGTKVTLIHRNKVLRADVYDQECVSLVLSNLVKGGLTTVQSSIDRVEKHEGVLKVTTNNGEAITCSIVLLAIGRKANISALGSTKVTMKKGFIRVNEEANFQMGNRYMTGSGITDDKLIWAAGDVVGSSPGLATTAINGTKLFLQNQFQGRKSDFWSLFFRKSSAPPKILPTCVFTPLEYANFGLSEEVAKKSHDNIQVYLKQFDDLYQGASSKRGSAPSSFAKVICKADNSILGLHLVSIHASESIEGLAIAYNNLPNFSINHLSDTIGIHPTVAEAFENLTNRKDDTWLEITGCGGGACV